MNVLSESAPCSFLVGVWTRHRRKVHPSIEYDDDQNDEKKRSEALHHTRNTSLTLDASVSLPPRVVIGTYRAIWSSVKENDRRDAEVSESKLSMRRRFTGYTWIVMVLDFLNRCHILVYFMKWQ